MNGFKKRELKERIIEVEEMASEAAEIAKADSNISLDSRISLTEKQLISFLEKGKSDEACNEDEEKLINTIELLKKEEVDIFNPSSSILKPTPLEIATLHQTIYLNEYIYHNPQTKQIKALLCPNEEALYGGAAGGGKSDFLLMFLLQYVEVKYYQSAVFRKSFMDLSQPGGLIPRSKEWLSHTDAKYNASEHQWTFPRYTSVLKFGYLDAENDMYRYQGGEYQRIGFDELPHIRPNAYEYLFSRKRKLEGSTVPTQVRSTANPDGPNYAYVKDRFVKPGHPDRPYIPSGLEDNRYLDIEDYENALKHLDDVTYKKLRHGNWEVQPAGRMFKGEWFIERKIDAEELPINGIYLRAWDLAASKPTPKNRDPDWTVGTKWCIDIPGRRLIVVDQKAIREDPGATEKFIRATAIEDGYLCEQWFEIEPGATGKGYQRHLETNILPDFSCHGERPSANKEVRAKPLAAACERGDVWLVIGDYIDPMLDQWCTFPDSDHKDRTDSASLGYKRAAQIYAKHFTGVPDEEEHRSEKPDEEVLEKDLSKIFEHQLKTLHKIDESQISDYEEAIYILEQLSNKYIELNNSEMAELILDEIDRIELLWKSK
jgi:phage terminase large subunit-like protein